MINYLCKKDFSTKTKKMSRKSSLTLSEHEEGLELDNNRAPGKRFG